MPIDVPLLARICEAPGAPGSEKGIRDQILAELEGLADEITTDAMGNVLALKKGRSAAKKVMAAAHMDEIGFIVTHIDDGGFLRFNPVGGFDPKTLTSQRVWVHGRENLLGVMGCKPVHILPQDERGKPLKITDYFIDCGLPQDALEKIVSVGDFVTRCAPLEEMGDCVTVKSLDNRLSVFLLLETLRSLKKSRKNPAYDFYAAFTVQEEVGMRGAHVAAHAIRPDFSIGLDVTLAVDIPGVPAHQKITSLGRGAAIKLMDSSVICDARMIAFMKDVATRHEISWQPEVLAAGGTDTAALQRMVPGGSIAGAISIPTRHIHQTVETAHKQDIAAAIQLLTACVRELDQGQWSL